MKIEGDEKSERRSRSTAEGPCSELALERKPAGVYRLEIASSIGTAETSKKSSHIIDYFIEDFLPDEEGLICAYVIEYTGRILPLQDRINTEQALRCRYICKDVTEYTELIKKISMLESHIRAGKQHYKDKEYYSSEYEYECALCIDSKNVEAGLGKAKALFKLERYEEARVIFDDLCNNPELYIEAHKHFFNECGIKLRRLRMYERAIEAYLRALEVNPFDPHLYYNLAIVHAEMKEKETSIRLLQSAIRLKEKLVHRTFWEAVVLLKSLRGEVTEEPLAPIEFVQAAGS